MKLGIVGSRKFVDYEYIKQKVLENYRIEDIDTIVSGGAKGVDSCAEEFAREFNKQMIVFHPDWDTYGKQAGFLRNGDIVAASDELIAFPGVTHGTRDTIQKAHYDGKKVIIYEVGHLCLNS